MKYIYYHMKIKNFKLFTDFLNSYVFADKLRFGEMFIINAEALCFIHQIIQKTSGLLAMYKSAQTNPLWLQNKERTETTIEEYKNYFDNVFPFLNKSSYEIDEICQRIFKCEKRGI